MSAAKVISSFGSDLTQADYRSLEARWITPELADAAMLRRVDSLTGRGIVGKNSGDYAGIVIPYALNGNLIEYRIRRDTPDLVVGNGGAKHEQKYAQPVGRGSRIYFP